MNVVVIYTLFVLLVLVSGCSSSLLLDKLRKQKTITFLPDLSSGKIVTVDEGAPLRLTCAFLSNFDRVDILWFHNGTVIRSFLAKTSSSDTDDNVARTYLAATIVTSIDIERAHLDTNGMYQCIAVHNEVASQNSFDLHVKPIAMDFTPTHTSESAMITVHTYQTLFEPRRDILLMCRANSAAENTCTVQWLDPEDEPVDITTDQTNLLLQNPTFDDHMGLYKCHVCCGKQCRTLTTFVYPAGSEN